MSSNKNSSSMKTKGSIARTQVGTKEEEPVHSSDVKNTTNKNKAEMSGDWIVRTSKKHPDRVYYFNVNTNKSSWISPVDMQEKPTTIVQKGASLQKGTKRKMLESAELHSSFEKPQNTTATKERPKIKAKRRVANAENNNEVKETPAMRAIREKILQKQKASANSNKNGKKSIGTKAETLKPEGTIFTAEMKHQYEKLQQRRSLGSGNKCKTTKLNSSISSTSSTCSTSTSSSTLSASDTDSQISDASTLILQNNTNTTKLSGRKRSIQERLHISSNNETVDTTRKNMNSSQKPKLTEVLPIRQSNLPAAKKNLANERLAKLRRSLYEKPVEKVEKISKQVDAKSKAAVKDVSPKTDTKKIKIDVTLPSYHANAEARLTGLKERVLRQQHYEQNKSQANNSCSSETVENNCEPSGELYFEEMEWEPIEDEKITSQIYAVRTELCQVLNSSDNPSQVPNNTLILSNESKEKRELYIVVDTNVFLSNLRAVEEARDTTFQTYGRPFLVVPWTVIQELDYIKDDKSKINIESLRVSARKAVRFLNDHFGTKHPRVLGQTPMDAAKNREIFEKECPDDEILQTCLQIRNLTNSVVLLSYDKNLCNKAMIHDITTLGRNDPFEKVEYLHVENSEFGTLFNAFNAKMDKSSYNGMTILQEELKIADDIMEEGKAVLKTVLTVVVAKEMEELFGDNWKLRTIIHPPWSVIDVLNCALKHWIAAVSESFYRKGQEILKTLKEIIKNPPTKGRRLIDALNFLEICTDLMQTLKVENYSDLALRANNGLEEQKGRCRESILKLNKQRLELNIGKEEDATREEQRAMVALDCFDKVYTFARDTCGKAAEMVRMPCTFKYNERPQELTNELVERLYPEVAANSNRLLQVLGTALEQASSLSPSDRTILALHDILTTFIPDFNLGEEMRLVPLDIFCCIKQKREVLRLGLTQLQELSMNFCRMASFRCT